MNIRIAVHQPEIEQLPLSLQRYYSSLKNHLENKGITLLPYRTGNSTPEAAQLLWDPYCGWPMGPIWPNDRTALPRIITFHGAAAFSMEASTFWGNPETALENESVVDQKLAHWLVETQHIDSIIVPSRFASWELSRFIAAATNQIHVAEHGVDDRQFCPTGSKEEQVGFLHVSAWQPKKNIGRIIEAYSLLPEETRPPLTLIVPQLSSEKFPQLNGIRCINESKSVDSLSRYYRGALALVFPSLHETFGMPIIEAMACGCPVITATGTALEELYKETAILVNPLNTSEIHSAMTQISQNSQLRLEMRQKGLQLSARMTWHKSAHKHITTFTETLSRTTLNKAAKQEKNTALFILGMHRSGTSALAGTLKLAGVDFGPDLLPPKPDNPKGFFEHREIVRIHDEILQKIGMRWDDPRPMTEDWVLREELNPLKIALKDIILHEFSHSSFWGLKDPRLCRLLPIWLPILEELQINLRIIIMMRDYHEIANSLATRNQLPVAQTQLLWLRHLLEAEQNTRNQLRIQIFYDDLLDNWQSVLEMISTKLGINWPYPLHLCTTEINLFLDRSLKHQNATNTSACPSQPDGWVENACEHLMQQNILEQHATWDNVSDELLEKDKLAKAYLLVLDHLHTDTENVHRELGNTRQDLIQTHETLHQAQCALLNVQRQLEQNQEEWTVKFHNSQHSLLSAQQKLEESLAIKQQLQVELTAMLRSRSWRLTRPLRNAGKIARHLWLPQFKIFFGRNNQSAEFRFRLARAAYYRLPLPNSLKRKLRNPVRHALSVPILNRYELWIKNYEMLTDKDRSAISAHIDTFHYKPLLSILLPTFNTPICHMKAAINSVRSQLYSHWELCIVDDASTTPELRPVLEEFAVLDERIKVHFRSENGHISEASNTALDMAQGEYVVLLDHDDMLSETALYFVALEINLHPELKIIYSDEDKINTEGKRLDPYFKPDYSYDLFLGQNMISHLGVYHSELVRSLGGFRKGYEGAQDWDLAIRCIEQIPASAIRHIPRILYHWRIIPGSTAMDSDQKPYAYQAQRRTLEEHAQRQNLSVQFVDHPKLPNTFHRARWPIPHVQPRVSILIPTYNAHNLLDQCINSIRDKTDYQSYEIIVIDNRSDDTATLAYLEQLAKEPNIQVLRYPQPFNYSAINNLAARQALGEVLVLLNNDTEVIQSDWLTEMVSHAIRPGVGAVGAKLLYPDGSIQHGGVILGLGGYAAHSHRGFPGNHPGQSGRLWLSQNYSAVTAACLAIRREVYFAVNGLDEENFSVAYNDVDLCLRLLEKGYLNIFTPYAELFHHESKTRGSDSHGEGYLRFSREKDSLLKRHGHIIKQDPYYNPNLTDVSEDFTLAYPPRLAKPWE